MVGSSNAQISLPFKGRAGVGMGTIRDQNTPIPLLTSPLKGEEGERREIGTNQLTRYPEEWK